MPNWRQPSCTWAVPSDTSMGASAMNQAGACGADALLSRDATTLPSGLVTRMYW